MPGSFTHDLNRWKQGDRDAQFDLERRLLPFLHELIRGMRRRTNASLKARINSHGVVYFVEGNDLSTPPGQLKARPLQCQGLPDIVERHGGCWAGCRYRAAAR